MREKISRIFSKIWAVAVFVLVFAGGISVLGFAAGFIIGGETGGNVISFIYNDIFKWIIFATSILIVFGWIKMEISGEQELTAGKRKRRT